MNLVPILKSLCYKVSSINFFRIGVLSFIHIRDMETPLQATDEGWSAELNSVNTLAISATSLCLELLNFCPFYLILTGCKIPSNALIEGLLKFR